MPTQRRFEGSTLDAVLTKVQKEIGPSARIVTAQKVRSGGVLGFFAREKFEIIVEVDPPAASPPEPVEETVSVPEPKIVPGTSLEDLANQVNESERIIDKPIKQKPKASKPIKALPAPAPIEAEEETKVPEPPPMPQISTESDSFAEVLSRMAFQADMQDEVREEVQAEEDEAEEKLAKDSISQEAVSVDDDPLRYVEHDDEEDYEYPDGEAVYVDTEAVEPTEDDFLLGPTIPDRPAFLDVRTKAPDVAERNIDGVAVPVTRTRKSDSPLALLGLPIELIPDRLDTSDSVSLRDILTEALSDLPQAPVIRPSRGSIIAVVGQRNEAMTLAEELADSYGRPRDEVVLASPDYRGREIGGSRLLRTVRDAEDAQRSWQRRNRPTIVAIEAGLGGRAVTWAEHVLTALEPIATYGVTDATRKSEDIAAWAGALGGIDCLAINHIHDTVSPAAVLATGIPIDRLDGRQASPAYWAMLLSERLTAA